MKINSFVSISLIMFLACGNLYSNSLDDDLNGFDDTQEISENLDSDLDGFSSDDIDDEIIQAKIIEEKSIFTLSGDLAFKTSVGYKKHNVKSYKTNTSGIDYSGVNQAQTSIYLQLDTKLSDKWKIRLSGDAYYDAIYDINSKNNYNNDTLDSYETQLRLDDTYIQGQLTRDIDLKVGRQKVVWGKSDNIRITDVINPLDNRLPGMTDIEDLRLSVGMAKLDYYVGMWNISAMAIVENRIMYEAAPRSEFFPVDNIFSTASDPFIKLEDPTTSFDNMQYALAANGVFSGWDLSFYTANVLDQKWHIDPSTQTRKVSKIKMLGSAINIATGNWLIKSELAYLNGVKYNSTTDAKNRFDALVGLEYMGIKDTVLSLEVASKHIFDYESQMSQTSNRADYVNKNELQTAMRLSRSFMNETINTNGLISLFGASWEYGGFARVWIEYELKTALNANFGVVDYIDGDKPFTKAVKDNDRIFADITYSF